MRTKGIYTTGSLQQAIYLNKQLIGKRAVIIGTEHVSYSALMTLKHAGVKAVAMIEEAKTTQSFQVVSLSTKIYYGYKLFTNSKLIDISGNERIESITIDHNNKKKSIKCDTVVFTANWIPDNELARRGNIVCDEYTKSPLVNSNFETSRKNVYAVGNLLLPIKSADQCVLDTRQLRINL